MWSAAAFHSSLDSVTDPHHTLNCILSQRSSSPRSNLSYSSQSRSYPKTTSEAALSFLYCPFRHRTCQEEPFGLVFMGQFEAEEHKVRGWDLCWFCCLNFPCSHSASLALTKFSRDKSQREDRSVAENLSHLFSLMWEKRGHSVAALEIARHGVDLS